MTVGDLLRRMSAAELSEWRAYYALEPFGPQIEDVVQARKTMYLAAQTWDFKNYPQGPQFETYLMGRKDQQAPEQMLKIIELVNAAYGGRDLRNTSVVVN